MSETRTELLAHELTRFGLLPAAAETLSCEVVSRHPLAYRIGLDQLTHRVIASGLAESDASHVALALWGLERLWLGACFQDLLEGLRHSDVKEADAYPACIAARQLWAASGAKDLSSDQDQLLLRWVALSASLTGLGAMLIHLGI